MLAQIEHGKPIGGAQEPAAELGSPIAESSYDSAETCASLKFVLAFNPTLQGAQDDILQSKR